MDLRVTRYAVNDRVALITLCRPERLNAWTSEMEREYLWCLATADADPETAVIVVTGAGRAFCAGGDMEVLSGGDVGGTYESAPVPLSSDARPDWAGTFSSSLGLAKPLIAAVNGAAAGRGFVLACFADIRFAAVGAKFTTSFARLGLPAEDGVSWLLPRIVGAGHAADLLFSSRVVLADEAERLGLVNRVYPNEELMPATLAYARAIAHECAPSALLALKRQLWGDLLDPLASAWEGAAERAIEAMQGPDFAEGVSAFVEKRPPRFRGVSLRRNGPDSAHLAPDGTLVVP